MTPILLLVMSMFVGTYGQLRMTNVAPSSVGRDHSDDFDWRGPRDRHSNRPDQYVPASQDPNALWRKQEDDRQRRIEERKREWEAETHRLSQKTPSDFEKYKIYHRAPADEHHIQWLIKCEDENLCDGSGNGDFYQRAFDDLRSQRVRNIENQYKHYGPYLENNGFRNSWESDDDYQKKKELFYWGRTNFYEGMVQHNNRQYGISRETLQLSELILDVVTSWTPGVSLIRDFYEASLGKDFITGEELSTFSRSMAIIGVASAGILKPATRVIGTFAKLARINPGPLHFLYEKPISELRNTITFFRKYKIFPRNTDSDGAQAFVNASMKGAKLITTDTDRVVYRYYLAGRNNPRGHWLTTDLTHNPIERLALENPGDYIAEKWIIPKGTEILEGVVAPNFGKAGGATQIVIGDYSLLRKSP